MYKFKIFGEYIGQNILMIKMMQNLWINYWLTIMSLVLWKQPVHFIKVLVFYHSVEIVLLLKNLVIFFYLDFSLISSQIFFCLAFLVDVWFFFNHIAEISFYKSHYSNKHNVNSHFSSILLVYLCKKIWLEYFQLQLLYF